MPVKQRAHDPDSGALTERHNLLDMPAQPQTSLETPKTPSRALKTAAARRRTVSPARRSGSVLIAVLAVVVLLSFLVSRFVSEAVEDLEYRSIFAEPVDVRSFAFSVLEISLATIHEIALIDDGKLYAKEQGWRDPLGYSGITIPNGWEVTVTVEDEGGKLGINQMSEEMLNKMFEETLEFDFGTARELTSTLKDWIDPDNERRLEWSRIRRLPTPQPTPTKPPMRPFNHLRSSDF